CLDVDPGPAEVVEVLGDRRGHRVVRADVDVESLALVTEYTAQEDVFAVLRVGDHRHGSNTFRQCAAVDGDGFGGTALPCEGEGHLPPPSTKALAQAGIVDHTFHPFG